MLRVVLFAAISSKSGSESDSAAVKSGGERASCRRFSSNEVLSALLGLRFSAGAADDGAVLSSDSTTVSELHSVGGAASGEVEPWLSGGSRGNWSVSVGRLAVYVGCLKAEPLLSLDPLV